MDNRDVCCQPERPGISKVFYYNTINLFALEYAFCVFYAAGSQKVMSSLQARSPCRKCGPLKVKVGLAAGLPPEPVIEKDQSPVI